MYVGSLHSLQIYQELARIIKDKDIYYDEQTQRAPIFEKNLLKDGFKIKQWND